MRRPRQKCRRSRGLQALADRDSLDWKDYDADTIFKRVTEHLQPGSIVLFHNAALHTPEALPSILEYMHQNGYTVVPIGSLIYTESYTIDHAGRQSPVQTEAGTSPAPQANTAAKHHQGGERYISPTYDLEKNMPYPESSRGSSLSI